MNSEFTQYLILLNDPQKVVRAMCQRRDNILIAIEEKKVEPTPDLLSELAELNIAIGDMDDGS
jgi:hypothetical protein